MVFIYRNWWDMLEFAHWSWILYRDFTDFHLVSFTKDLLLCKSITKFFKRHGAIIEKYGTTLREIR